MNERQSHTMRWVLFWVFVSIFVITCVGTLAMVFFGWGSSQGEERKFLVTGVVVQTATSVFALFYSLFGMKKAEPAPTLLRESERADTSLASSADVVRLTNECSQLRLENERLSDDLERICALPDRILGELGAGESLSIEQLSQRMGTTDVVGVQATVGRLFQNKIIEADSSRPAGYYRIVRPRP